MTNIAHSLTLALCLTTASLSHSANSTDANISLNHFFVIVDEATFRDIQENRYLRNTFAVTETRTTRRNDHTYSGFYVYGSNTYFEIMTESASLWESAIILSGDSEGELQRLKEAHLPQLDISMSPISREFEDRQVPWFYTAENIPYDMFSKLGVGILEYHPQYLSQYYPDTASRVIEANRKNVLARYASILDISPSARLFEDVVGITATVLASERSALIRLFESLGFVATMHDDYSTLTSQEFELRLTSRPGSLSRILEVQLQLNKTPPSEVLLQFGGNSTLRISTDGNAVWAF